VYSLGYHYYITFVDAYSRFTWIYPLKVKSDALTIFKQFKTMAKLQLGHPLKALQTDWGGEFRPFTQHLTSLGITHRLICPHTHHQNGVVERKHRHIVYLGLTLLTQASMPLTYWDHAFLTSVYLINRLPTASLNFQIPYQVLYHQIPNYNFLKVFGCACFPLFRPYNAYKFDFRSHECLFLGYSSSHKGGRIFISKDVLFNEYRFPYCDLFTDKPYDHLTPVKDVSLSSLPIHNSIVSLSKPFPTHKSPSPPSNTSATSPIPTVSAPNTESVSSADSSQQLVSSKSVSVPTPTPPINTHPMTTRSKSSIVLPRVNPTLMLTHTEPKTVRQALADPQWKNAMQKEFAALQKKSYLNTCSSTTQ
jgi:hypothetical protein